MKNTLTAFIASLILGSAFSQNTFPSTGNVGIGTTSPAKELHVNGQLQVESNALFNGPTTFTSPSVSMEELWVSGTIVSYGDLQADGETRLQDLNVYGNLVFPSLQMGEVGSATTFLIKDNSGVIKKIDGLGVAKALYSIPCITDLSGNVPTPVWNNGTNKLYTNCVNVGVGTTNPLYMLDIRGTGFFEKGIRIGKTAASTLLESDQAIIEIETSDAAPFMRLSTKSGSSDPVTRFKVENTGELLCTSVRVKLATDIAVPDYVFKPDYQLMPLSELKAYVTKNSHLPNIPSEAEIKAEGLNVEEMQLKLLEKVEQLTLYVIQQEEKIQQQNVKIAELQNQLSNQK